MMKIVHMLFAISVQTGAGFACVATQASEPPDRVIEASQAFDEATNVFEKIDALSKMMAANTPAMRDAAIEMGLRPENEDAVRAAALACRFADSSRLVVTTLPFEEAQEFDRNMSDAVAAAIEAGAARTLAFFGHDAGDGCASLSSRSEEGCPPTYRADVRGLTVSYIFDTRQDGNFTLTNENRLIGTLGVWTGSELIRVPAEASLN